MFMFRSKRDTLIKRLLKARVRGEITAQYEAGRTAEDGAGMDGGSVIDVDTLRTRVFDQLRCTQLQLLVGAVCDDGDDLSMCVLLPRDSSTAPGEVQLLCCQAWRWPDLRRASQLRRLPECESASDPVYQCCNPYHFSRLCEPETPPPPYSRFAEDELKPEDRAPSEVPLVCGDRSPGSLTTSGEGGGLTGEEWCKLAYWEQTQRVGQQFPVRCPTITVFSQNPRGNGLCLATLAQHSFSPPLAVLKTREKIGHGVILSLEGDGVWAYNISSVPIFVNSPTLGEIEARSLMVYRIPPGYCLRIHDEERASRRDYGWRFPEGPIDPNSIRISFAKGWGPKYTRQEITACPCWLEVLLAPCR